MQLEFHPLANIFPLMEGQAFADLVADIKEHGQREPIVLHTDGTILDGRNRFRACVVANVEPKFETWDGVGLASDFVWSLNGPRRHLDGGALVMAAGRYSIAREAEARERQGARTDLTSVSIDTEVQFGKSRQIAAEKFGVPEATIGRSVKVLKDGSAELVRAVESGAVSVSAAADVATLPKAEQAEIVAKGEREILEAAKQIRAAKAEERRAERIEKIAEISRGNAPLGVVAERYPVLYVDPPWRYEHIETESRAIENQYPTMSLDEIKAMPIDDIAFADCVLFMWATSPKLEEAFEVLAAWGFSYRTCAVWDKQKIGMGYYFRQQHELLLVAVRGSPPTPSPVDRPASVFSFPRGAHSVKPHEVYEIIEAMYPSLPKLEMFCRTPRQGWGVWGNQSGGV